MKHAQTISKMTLEEKCVFLSGKNTWETRDYPPHGIPSVWLADGPHGLRKQTGAADHLGLHDSEPATCFPTAAAVANSWNTALGEAIGTALGEEAAAQNVGVVLGPGLNMKRSPLCGRSFEYFSEDPYLAGKLAAAYIRGIQSKGVAACPKHFAVNSQETCRMASNSVLDERTLREVYLTGFEIAVKEGNPRAIMAAYNEVNGVYANENSHLLQEILREEWGFDGAVITDWGASNDHVEGVRCGSTLEMPSPGLDSARELIAAVQAGRLDESLVDARADELLCLVDAADAAKAGQPFDAEAHHALARRAAEESIVLLKNENALLPLAPGTRVAVLGDFAFAPRYQGAGSSMVNPTRLDTTVDGLALSGLKIIGTARGYERGGAPNEKEQAEAVELAKQADVALVWLGLDEMRESEGLDRQDMKLAQNQLALLHAVAGACDKVVCVLCAGSAVEMGWQSDATAVVYGCLGGQAGAGAMLDVLTGKVNPSGRLAETLPEKLEDTPAYRFFPGKERSCEYREGLYIGYRYYETAGVPVSYPFGHGLSYTHFAYRDITATPNAVTFMIENTGRVDGIETAQVYVAKADAKVFRPAKELKGFARVVLAAGERRSVTVPLDEKAFRYFNVKTNRWEVEGGAYQILVGASARDIRLTAEVTAAGTGAPLPYEGLSLPDYGGGRIQNVPDEEFAALLGHKLPNDRWRGELDRNDALCQMYYAKSGAARLLYRILRRKLRKSGKGGVPNLDLLFTFNMPFRGIAKLTGGAVSMEMADGMVTVVNGHFFRGMKRVIDGHFRNARLNKEMNQRLDAAAKQ